MRIVALLAAVLVSLLLYEFYEEFATTSDWAQFGGHADIAEEQGGTQTHRNGNLDHFRHFLWPREKLEVARGNGSLTTETTMTTTTTTTTRTSSTPVSTTITKTQTNATKANSTSTETTATPTDNNPTHTSAEETTTTPPATSASQGSKTTTSPRETTTLDDDDISEHGKELDFNVRFINPEEARGPPGDYRGAGGDCPDSKPLCKTRVAVLMTGHLRESLENGRHGEIKAFLDKCREETAQCDLFLHTWKYQSFETFSWYTQGKRLEKGRLVDISSLCERLNCTGVHMERQILGNIDIEREWGKSGITYEGARMVAYSLYAANHIRKMHIARFGVGHDVTVRIRPDYYRTAHSGILRPQYFRTCIQNLRDNSVMGVSKYYPGGARPRHLQRNGQVRRPWNGNSGDNFFMTRAHVFDKMIDYWIHHYDEVAESTHKWNELNTEADIGTVMERLGFDSTVCGQASKA